MANSSKEGGSQADPSQEEVAELLLLGRWLRPGNVEVTVSPGQPARFLVDPDEVQAILLTDHMTRPLLPIAVEYADAHGVRVATVRQTAGSNPVNVRLLVVGQMVMTSSTAFGYQYSIR